MTPKLYGYNTCPVEIKDLIGKIVESFKSILKDNLVGIYLHGSLAMNCFNPESGDIDFLAVVKEKLGIKTKKKLIEAILEISKSEHLPKKEFEFSVVLEKYLKDFVYPTPFELHYSKRWKQDYETGKVDYTKENRDPDLAAHITVTIHRGICIYGKPIKEVFYKIPEKYYIRSILYDLEDIEKTIQKDPVYAILNLCRVLYYLKEKVISSKSEAGVWGMKNIPEFNELIQKALASYRGEIKKISWDKKELLKFSKNMMDKLTEIIHSTSA